MAKVIYIEYEAGWGSRIDEIQHVKTFKEAQRIAAEFNKKNNKKKVPDWYMIAEAQK